MLLRCRHCEAGSPRREAATAAPRPDSHAGAPRPALHPRHTEGPPRPAPPRQPTHAAAAAPRARRSNPVLRDRLFFGVVGVGIVHGSWLILRSSSLDGEEKEVFLPPPGATVPARRPASAAAEVR